MYKNDFPLLMQNPNIHYLDSAATAQRPMPVIEGIKRCVVEVIGVGKSAVQHAIVGGSGVVGQEAADNKFGVGLRCLGAQHRPRAGVFPHRKQYEHKQPQHNRKDISDPLPRRWPAHLRWPQ